MTAKIDRLKFLYGLSVGPLFSDLCEYLLKWEITAYLLPQAALKWLV